MIVPRRVAKIMLAMLDVLGSRSNIEMQMSQALGKLSSPPQLAVSYQYPPIFDLLF